MRNDDQGERSGTASAGNATPLDETGNESLIEAIVTAVTSQQGVEPTELRPLYAVVEPDALTALLQPTYHADERGYVRVAFTYGDCNVTVDSDGRVEVTPRESPHLQGDG